MLACRRKMGASSWTLVTSAWREKILDTIELAITRIASLNESPGVVAADWEKRIRTHAFGVAAATVLFVQGLSIATSNAAGPGSDDPDNWPQYHRTHNAWRFSPLTQINRGNVKQLKVAWIHQPGDITHGIQATPLAIDGVIYYVSAFNGVHALDGATGKAIWQYKPKLDPAVTQLVFPAWSRGVAVAHGRVYLGTLDGRGIALDQKTGQEIWSTQLTRFKGCHGCNFTSPPVVAGDVLTFGATGGDLAQSGDIYGVDAHTGRLLWTFAAIEGRSG